MSKELASKLDAMDLQGVDVTDANAVAQMMGYDTLDDAGNAAPAPQGDTTTAPAAPAPAPAEAPAAPAAPAASPTPSQSPAPAPVDSSAPPAAAAEQPGQIAGVLTKDGKHVIPHRVLQDARSVASLERQRADELAEKNAALEKQLEDLKAGRAPVGTDAQYTAEQLAEIEADHPQLAPLLRAVEKLQQQVPATAPATAPTPQQIAGAEVSAADALDMALAPRPLLSQFRSTGGVVWQRAIEIDSALVQDAAFKDMDPAQRFEEVERRLATELGVPVPGTLKPPAAPAPAAAAPAPAAPAAPAVPVAPTQTMPTLTDLGGGAVAVGDPMSGMTVGQMVDKAAGMDMESLRRMAGLSY